MPILPVLNGEEFKSLLKTMKEAKLKPYTDEQCKRTDEAIERILAKRIQNKTKAIVK